MRRRDALKYALLGTVGAVGISVLDACGQAPAPTAPAIAPTTPPPAATSVPQAQGKPTQAAAAPTSAPVAAATKPTAAPAQSTLKKGGTVTLGTAQDFPGLDPMLTTLFNANNLHTLIWQSLTRFDANMDVQP